MSPLLSAAPAIDGNAPARGFVLVGVAMFVLVLTILGLSLFSLSSFEAQFYARYSERSRAFNAAAGGIERARFALVAGNTLQSVKSFLPRDGVDYAVAVQGPDPLGDDTTGAVQWDGDDIWVRVEGRDGQSRVVLQARFTPSQPEDFYKRLISARQVQVDKYFSGSPRWSQTYVSGAVMQSDADTSWNNPPDAPLSSPLPRPPIEFRGAPVPLPALDSYFAAKMPLTVNYVHSGGTGNYTLNAGLGGVRYFYRAPGSPSAVWTVDETNNSPMIFVTGTAIWLADPGIRFRGSSSTSQVTVVGTNPLTDCLIIVARPKDRLEATEALTFRSGINSNIPIILVSDGKVRFDSRPSNYDVSSSVPYLSIYSARVRIGGPMQNFPPTTMNLMHTPSLLPNQLEPIIDALYALNILPSSDAGATSRLTLVPGTWQNLSASTP